MGKFLQSGRRRDICVLLAAEPRQAQSLKTALESHYDERIDPQSFYGALGTLVDNGFLETRREGIHDVYELTAAGEARLEEHVVWVLDHVAVGETGKQEPDGDGN
ncbi:MAG: helix-turn-helix transcriptional regulator [Halovenus sp.]